MTYIEENYDIVVVGAGHAGCEAALAAARMGLSVILFTVSMDSNIYYVVFHSDEYGDKVAISNKPTVELRENTTYTVTAYPVKDHTFASWSTTANGTLGSTSANPTTYTVTDDATLTVTGQ